MADDDDDGRLSDPGEDARLRRRDRKRTTRMVMDNAGIRRIALALQVRAGRSRTRDQGRDAPKP